MKELTIEEKAKSYDEAIEVARSKIKNNKDHVLYEEDITDIFPELKDINDERIKKVIRGWIYTRPTSFFDNGISKEEILAWIEKQGEKDKLIQELGEYKVKYIQETLEKASTMNNKDNEKIRKAISDILLIDSDEIREILDANNVLMQDIDTWLEKQDGQKPVPDWMPKFLDELRTKKNYFDWDEHKDIEGYILAIINWMKPNYFNRKDDEHKPAWSKEDESWLEEMELMCLNFSNDTDYRDKFSTWLKSLKDRVQPKQEWSEDDETKLKSACALIRNTSLNGNEGVVDSTIDWLKSFRERVQPQPKQDWKPSEEQIKALNDAITKMALYYGGHYYNKNNYSHLKKLLEQLKQI